MNLEEEFKKEQEEVKEKTISDDISKFLSSVSHEQLAKVVAILNNTNQNTESKEETKEISKDYKDNFVLPKDDEQETIGCDFDKLTEQVSERYNRTTQEPTDISQLIENAFDTISDELELDISYRGTIKDIKLVYGDNNGKYDSIVVNYELNDNGLTKYTNDYYRFNWEYNHININKLVYFLKTIDGFYKDDFIAFTVEDIQNELKFLIGANISLKQNLNSGGYRENKVTVLGTFDRLNRRMVDE